VTVRRIYLRPDLRPGGKTWGKTPMVYQGEVIGSAHDPEYAAARWLLDNDKALPTDKLETYRGETLCMSGTIGKLAKWTVTEHEDPGKHHRPTLELVRWRPSHTYDARSPAAEEALEPQE
jgi:hypothetical protein